MHSNLGCKTIGTRNVLFIYVNIRKVMQWGCRHKLDSRQKIICKSLAQSKTQQYFISEASLTLWCEPYWRNTWDQQTAVPQCSFTDKTKYLSSCMLETSTGNVLIKEMPKKLRAEYRTMWNFHLTKHWNLRCLSPIMIPEETVLCTSSYNWEQPQPHPLCKLLISL